MTSHSLLWSGSLDFSAHSPSSLVMSRLESNTMIFKPEIFTYIVMATAVLQSIARKNQWPLDKMTLTVDVTKKLRDDFGHPPREGSYIHGLFMEGQCK